MPHLKSLPEDARLLHVFKTYPAIAGPLMDLHDAVLRQESPLSPGQREMIAAYVSGLNQCRYCHGVHTVVAEQFGVPEGLLQDLMADPERAAVDARMRPLLAYVRKLTETPSRLTEHDAQAVYDAGFDERALHDAVAVTALYNFMNRYVEGLGIETTDAYNQEGGTRLATIGYAGLKEMLLADA
ncbi:MAG: peroxidase-related enzyme [Geminicoccaceae bacterium]|nr:peroxidase-related enzyme [Geminicoccaceae bacterium]